MRVCAKLRTAGFTLMELMIALAVVGIIAAIALPNYQESVRKTRRSDAKVALNNVAQQLERCRTQFGAYNDAACLVASPQDSAERYYRIATTRAASTYALTAVPQGAQTADAKCTALSLDHLGQRSATGSDAANCW